MIPVINAKSDLISLKKNFDSPIIDVRQADDFYVSHWLDSSNFPVENLLSRQYELPSNNQPLQLIGNSQQLQKAKDILIDKGYVIDNCIEWSESLSKRLFEFNLLSNGSFSPRLWSPAAILEFFHENILIKKQIGHAVDIGCGAGRDSVYLATQGWQVTAIDYSESALEKVTRLANNTQVKINCIKMDLEKELNVFHLTPQDYDLIVVSRYLHRPLLPVLKNKININGYLIYQTFMKGCEAFGSPKNPKFLLEKGELASVFNDFEILLDEVHYIADGRPINRFIAKRIK